MVAELRHAGVEATLAEDLVREVELHVTPFADPAPLRDLVRSRIAAEIRVAGGWAAGGRAHTIVLLGPSAPARPPPP